MKNQALFSSKDKSKKLKCRLLQFLFGNLRIICYSNITVKILKIGTPEIITIIVLQLEQLDFTVQYCVQKMQTE